MVQILLVVTAGAMVFTAIAQTHMALHQAKPPTLARAAVVVCLAVLGASATRWRGQHNELHHRFLNQDGLDPDIDFEPVFRLRPSQVWRRWHRYQAWYCWFVYPFTFLGMTLGSFRIVLQGSTRDGRRFSRRRRLRVLAEVALGPPVMLGACIAWLGAPAGVLDWVGTYLVAGVLLGMTFQINHCSLLAGESIEWRNEVGLGRHDRVLLGTLDVCPESSALAHFTGSLNRHCAHHLIPSRDQAWIAAKTKHLLAHEPGYRYVTSLGAALAAHGRYMRRLSLPPDFPPETTSNGALVAADHAAVLTR